jgi:hypothetical protein
MEYLMYRCETISQTVVWAATTPGNANQAFNVANGDIFRWSWLWKQVAEYFGIEYQVLWENKP